tara:strand:- start:6235 stop:6891 length:657 start_codon:yes stop_codon:yes gene_type:complete
MEKVLFIAYNFPPMGGPGVHRSLKFVTNLRNFGYDPIVLTTRKEDVYSNMHSVDKSLLNDVPVDIRIDRLKAYDTLPIFSFLSRLKLYRIFWYLVFPLLWERDVLWPILNYQKIKKIASENDIKLVYTSSGPFSTLWLGYFLKTFNGLKWIADLRDPCTDGYGFPFPSKVHWYMARRIEKWILGKCDHLIVNTNEVRSLYIKRKIMKKENISTIISGY